MDYEPILRNLGVYPLLPQRVIVGVFAFLAIVNAFALRHSMELIMPAAKSDNIQPFNENPALLKHLKQRLKFTYHGDNLYQQKLKWRKRKWLEAKYNKSSNLFFNDLTPKQRHFALLLTFYVGYIVSHIPGALLAERYSVKWVLAITLLLSALLTLLTPYAIKHCSVSSLFILRLLLGLSQGPVFPAVTHLLSHWIPPNERGTLLPFILNSGQLGILLVNVLFAFLVTNFEWYFIFYFIAAGTFLWFICFILFCFNEPETNPYISETELLYLQQTVTSSRDDLQTSQSLTRPWRQILLSPPIWALILASIQHDWSQSLLFTELQNILQELKSFNLWPNFWTCFKIFLPLLLNWLISILAGVISDLLIREEILNTTEVRQIMTLIAAFGPKICSDFTSCIVCNESCNLNYVFNCALGLMGPYYAGIKLTVLDMSPTYAGTLMAVANGIGCLGSILAYYLEYLTEESETLQNLRSLLWLIITMFTSGEVQDFDHNAFEMKSKIN